MILSFRRVRALSPYAFTLLCACCAALTASDWTRFRGPKRLRISADKGLPVEIAKDRNVVWSQKTLKGNSSPIVSRKPSLITVTTAMTRVCCVTTPPRNAAMAARRAETALGAAESHERPSTPTPTTDGSRSSCSSRKSACCLSTAMEGRVARAARAVRSVQAWLHRRCSPRAT